MTKDIKITCGHMKSDMTNELRTIFCKSVKSMESDSHTRFVVVTALMLRIKASWVVLLDSMAFIQDTLTLEDDSKKCL
jgi:hypothetical protein